MIRHQATQLAGVRRFHEFLGEPHLVGAYGAPGVPPPLLPSACTTCAAAE